MAEKYLGRTEIGRPNDIEAFTRVMDETPLPLGVGEEENCQSWVKDVISNAVEEGIIGEEALDEMWGIPIF